ncbi:cyclic nucleotide-binding and patatin-like phospholipase domain-containing protein [Hyphomicrobium sp.]|jgi:NTE family protein|uniref:cyclic nucleotide-binding and patatin-like phospholipase domain-containing protein n=1 Tax=Hyphomicrobium sp. TaxID=82 RepID=UPI002C6E9CF0|nr:cyclic nucleotide-binding and patatin-like phospholipase domain-containing protein [Hyphomicrobium sp.]HVZ03491.1 cyclic nucleotide-binding and patatin-like phospholipase domain-containing protein [Hyphomicrobium sp.]
MSFEPYSLARVATFRDLTPETLRLLESRLQPLPIQRGTRLVQQGDEADALYVVVSGRFAVEINGRDDPVAEISQGSTIGEIAFLAGGARTATVRAIRDSVVARLTRADFDAIAKASPGLWIAVTSTLAERLAIETRRRAEIERHTHFARTHPRPRTIAIIGACDGSISPAFLKDFLEAADAQATTAVVSSDSIQDVCGHFGRESGGRDLTEILNGLESRLETVVFIADRERTAWSEKAIRQADELLIVAGPLDDPVGATVTLGALEQLALSLHRPASRRLVLVHRRKGIAQGTRHWLAAREPAMHHHVAMGDAEDAARLWRFINGAALGFVACGGGAYCAAHIGIYRAFCEANIHFDLIGGTSGGAAMAAAFAQDIDPFEIDAGVHRMFIEGRAMARYTLPRYGLLDHTHFDAHLEKEYGGIRIEDLWKPYFAVSADLSIYEPEVHRSGRLWQAIRASAAVPGLLPPYYTDDGRMLVDGSVIANVPIEAMHSLKSGPNVVVSFDAPESQRFSVDYATLPKRSELIWRSFNPLSKQLLPQAPSAATVLVRSLMANRSHFERYLTPDDWLLLPPTPADMGALDWRRHSEIMENAYRYARSAIAAREKSVFR